MGCRWASGQSVSLLPAIQATGLPIVTPAGLTPAGLTSLFWTHNAAGTFQRTTLSSKRRRAGPTGPPSTCVRDTGGPRAPPSRWLPPTCALSCITQAPRRGQPVLACTPSPHLLARVVRFAPAVKPAPGVLRVLRRHSPLVGLAPRRRSRVPTQVTSEDGLGVPFEPLWLFTTAQPPRSASGQVKTTYLAAWAEQRGPAPPLRGRRSCIRRIRPVPFTVWTLGFNRCRLRRAIRASAVGCLGGFGILGLLTSMLPSPWGFPAG